MLSSRDAVGRLYFFASSRTWLFLAYSKGNIVCVPELGVYLSKSNILTLLRLDSRTVDK